MYYIEGFFKIGIIISLFIIYIFIEVSVFKVKKVEVRQEKIKLKKPIKIIQISDYHNNKLINKNRLLRKIKKIKPDIIVLTGDMISDYTKDFTDILSLLKEIVELNSKVYSVSGNHELRNSYGNEFKIELENLGIKNIEFSNNIINIDEININLCGIPFNLRTAPNNRWQSDDNSCFTVLLSHSPKTAIEYDRLFYDLALTGHMHGGQIRLPFIGAIVTPYGGLFPKYNKGLYKLKDRWVYVDSGLGYSTFPIRIFNRVQISYIKIMNQTQKN